MTEATTTTPSDAAAFAGWACNPNAPIPERLKCAQVALDYYVDQQDKLHDLLEQYETLIADEAEELGYYERMYARPVYRAIRDRLRLILGVGDDQDEGRGQLMATHCGNPDDHPSHTWAIEANPGEDGPDLFLCNGTQSLPGFPLPSWAVDRTPDGQPSACFWHDVPDFEPDEDATDG